MSQAINFYEKLGPESRMPGAVVFIWSAWLFVVLAYLCWFLYVLYQQTNLSDQLSLYESENAAMGAQLKAEADAGDSVMVRNLEQQIAGLKRRRNTQGLLITHLSTGQYQNTYGFSNLLSGLARQHDGSVSLNMIETLDSGVLRMSGELVSAEDLPAFILRLGQETAFHKRAFETVEISEGDQGLEFKVESATRAGSRLN